LASVRDDSFEANEEEGKIDTWDNALFRRTRDVEGHIQLVEWYLKKARGLAEAHPCWEDVADPCLLSEFTRDLELAHVLLSEIDDADGDGDGDDEDGEEDEDDDQTTTKQHQLLRQLSSLASRSDRSSQRHTLLHIACLRGLLPVVATLLSIRHGVKINEQSSATLSTPLHYAAQKGHLVICAALVVAGANRSIEDDRDRTAEKLAKKNGRTDVISLLQML
jgi:ankyrin repeat protein